jgi:DNA-binding Xre family transcriptional regulator
MIRLKVREIAEQKEISRTRLSRIADVNYKTINDIYADPYRSVQYHILVKLAKALEVDVADLTEEIPGDM